MEHPKSPRNRRVNAIALAVAIIAIVCAWTILFPRVRSHFTLESDESMIAVFHRDRTQFMILDEEFKHGRLPKVHDSYGWHVLHPDTPEISSFLDAYGEAVFRIHEDGKMLIFYVDGWGGSFGGPRKGYAWRAAEPVRQVSSVDQWKPTAEDREAFRHIEGGWYIWMIP